MMLVLRLLRAPALLPLSSRSRIRYYDERRFFWTRARYTSGLYIVQTSTSARYQACGRSEYSRHGNS
ncbi:uncharacterized [Tachysurus ichikawai]